MERVDKYGGIIVAAEAVVIVITALLVGCTSSGIPHPSASSISLTGEPEATASVTSTAEVASGKEKSEGEPSSESALWQTYTHPAAIFDYPAGWKIVESQGAFYVERPTDSASFIQIFYGSAGAATNTNICYTHNPSDFQYWSLERSQEGPPITTRDGLKLSKLFALDARRYYVCHADKRTSFEAISYGHIAENVFDHVVQTFHFTLLEPISNWNTYTYEGLVKFKLPTTVPELECNQPQCFSKGTPLPGATRLTMVLREKELDLFGSSEQLAKDLANVGLYTSQMTIRGKNAFFFVGEFIPQENKVPFHPFGKQKVKIKGYTIEVDDDTFLEVSIAAPVDKGVDFHMDDQLLTEIIGNLQFIQ